MCRRQHGTAFSTYCQIVTAGLEVRAGADRVRSFASSPGIERCFCAECGSKLWFITADAPDTLWVAAGALDDEPLVQASSHIFAASKAPWYDICDQLPQYETLPTESAVTTAAT